jgi:NAD(P)-dependent dehydrogenase (short-subunit alcohol dehydrogenase family)
MGGNDLSKVMIVTGAGRGIGAAIARLAGSKGYDVAVNYARTREKAEAVAREIEGAGRRAIAVQADIGVEAEVMRLFEMVDEALGPVDTLVNNAGVDYETAIVDMKLGGLQRVYAVNIFGPFLCARESIKRMSTKRGGKGGVIVNIGSISARYGGLPGDVVYASSKGAVDAFTMGLARELGSQGIRVACVRPGLIRTEIFDANIGIDRAIEIAKATTMIGRIGEPEEIANMVLWLCSEEASYVTGTIHDVTGGR